MMLLAVGGRRAGSIEMGFLLAVLENKDHENGISLAALENRDNKYGFFLRMFESIEHRNLEMEFLLAV